MSARHVGSAAAGATSGAADKGRIIVGVDGSPQADRALRWAVREAELRMSTVAIVHCFVGGGGPVARAQERQLAETRLEAITARNRDLLDRVQWSVAATAVAAVPSSGLIAAAVDAELLVVGARGAEGFQRLRLGSTGYRTAAHSTVPVAVISADGGGSEEMDGRRPLVVGVDGSPTGRRALRWAIDEGRRRAVRVTVAHAYRLPVPATPEADVNAREDADAILRGLAHDMADDRVLVETVIVHGAPAGSLLELSGSDRLLVVGTRGSGPLTDMPFGSVSHQCLHHACGPTVIVP
jgi:nucleotide-binding universal stress UspA family protein